MGRYAHRGRFLEGALGQSAPSARLEGPHHQRLAARERSETAQPGKPDVRRRSDWKLLEKVLADARLRWKGRKELLGGR